MRSAADLLEKLNAVDESPRIGTKLASELGKSIMRSVWLGSLTVEELATLLGKDRDYLRNKHLTRLVRDGQLRFRYPESTKYRHQAYVAPMDKEEQP
jgi:ATP-dependent DNA helicase RecG